MWSNSPIRLVKMADTSGQIRRRAQTIQLVRQEGDIQVHS